MLRFRFLRDAFAMVGDYRWLEASPMARQDTRVFLLTIAAGLSLMAVAWCYRNPESDADTRRPLFLMSAPLFALALSQTGLVRADWFHIAVALYPIIVFSLLILLGTGSIGRTRSITLALVAIGASALIAGPARNFKLSQIRDNYSFHRAMNCPTEGFVGVDHLCLGSPEGQIVKTATDYLVEHTQPGESLLIYPYENEFGDAARRRVAGGVLQNYVIGGRYLTRRQLDGLQSQRPGHGLYFVDNEHVWRIDGISNFSRTPDIWMYMQSHYRTEAEVAYGVFVLVRDEGRAQTIRQQSTELSAMEHDFVIKRTREQFLDLGLKQWPQDADFLKLTLRLRYPLWWKLRKPSQITLIFDLADGSARQVNVVIEPNKRYELWAFPWDEKELGRYLSSREANWRPNQRPAVWGIKLYINKTDWVSQLPTSLSIERAEAVHLSQANPSSVEAANRSSQP